MRKLTILSLILNLFAIVCVGQDLTFDGLGSAKKGKYQSYRSQDGTLFKIGDTVKIGLPSSAESFLYITSGEGTWRKRLPTGSAGQVSEIIGIEVDGLKGTGYKAFLITKAKFGNYTFSVENAIAAKELVSTAMTSDQALAELKKAKDKLDLGLITKEQYEAIKLKLSKLIN